MIPNYYFIISLFLLLILFSITKKRKKILSNIVIILFILLCSIQFLPSLFRLKRSSISDFDGKEIKVICLSQSLPGWNVNLSDTTIQITNKSEIDSIKYYLQNTVIASLTHPERIWQESIILISKYNDTLKLDLHKTKNNGNLIYAKNKIYKCENIDIYLENLIRKRH